MKAVSDVFAPLSGEMIEVNEALADAPERINADPYGDGLAGQGEALATPPRPSGCWTPAAYQQLLDDG